MSSLIPNDQITQRAGPLAIHALGADLLHRHSCDADRGGPVCLDDERVVAGFVLEVGVLIPVRGRLSFPAVPKGPPSRPASALAAHD